MVNYNLKKGDNKNSITFEKVHNLIGNTVTICTFFRLRKSSRRDTKLALPEFIQVTISCFKILKEIILQKWHRKVRGRYNQRIHVLKTL